MQWPPDLGLGTTETITILALAGAFVVLAVLLLVVRARRRRRQRRRTGSAPAVPQTSPVAQAAPPTPPTVKAGGMPSPPPMVPGPTAVPLPPLAAAPTIAAGPTPTADAGASVASLSEAELAQALRQQLGGGKDDAAHATPASAPDRVVWVEGGDELLVHLDSLRVQLLDRILLTSLDLETDQMGRQAIVVPYAFASEGGPGGLVAVTEAAPRGDTALVARWGHTVQEAIWAALLSLARDVAAARGLVPLAIAAVPGSLRLRGGPLASHPVPQPVTHPAS